MTFIITLVLTHHHYSINEYLETTSKYLSPLYNNPPVSPQLFHHFLPHSKTILCLNICLKHPQSFPFYLLSHQIMSICHAIFMLIATNNFHSLSLSTFHHFSICTSTKGHYFLFLMFLSFLFSVLNYTTNRMIFAHIIYKIFSVYKTISVSKVL